MAGEDEPGTSTAVVGVGGDIPNVLVSASVHGAPTRLLSRVGDDEAGRRLRGLWAVRGVDVLSVAVSPKEPTGLYLNIASGQGHAFDYYRRGSAAAAMRPCELPPDWTAQAAALVVSGITLAVMPEVADSALSMAARAEVPVALVVNYRPSLPPTPYLLTRAAEQARWLFASSEDLEALDRGVCGERASSPWPAAETVLTLGPRGAVLHHDGDRVHATAPHVQAVDAAGAGDALAGAYLAARLTGTAGPDALRGAVAYAAATTTARGCAAAYPMIGTAGARVGGDLVP